MTAPTLTEASAGQPPAPLRVIAYQRVSTVGQLDGYGLEGQAAAIAAWAEAQSPPAEVVATHAEQVSGTVGFAERPALAAALAAIVRDGVDGLIVPRLDRLARQLHEQEAALAHVWRSGHRVWSADAGEVLADDPADPMRTAMRQMLGVFAQLEKGMIVARLGAGRKAKRAATGWTPGPAPYGWSQATDGTMTPIPAQQQVLDWMRQARSGGISLRAMADTLNQRGQRGPRGGAWQHKTISRVLASADRLAQNASSAAGGSPTAGAV